MSNTKSSKMYKEPYHKTCQPTGWDAAIHEAERLMGEARALAARLKATAKHFRKMKETGETFPAGHKSANGVLP